MGPMPSSPNAFFICVTRSAASAEWESAKWALAFGVTVHIWTGRPRGRACSAKPAKPSAASAPRCWRTAIAVRSSLSASESAETGPSRLTRESTAKRPGLSSGWESGMACFLKYRLAKSNDRDHTFQSLVFLKGTGRVQRHARHRERSEGEGPQAHPQGWQADPADRARRPHLRHRQ